jgi:hypothetical protein
MVESIRRREGETVVESNEGEVVLKVERRESKVETDLRDGSSWEEEESGEGCIESWLEVLKVFGVTKDD